MPTILPYYEQQQAAGKKGIDQVVAPLNFN
jgi:hypothetical protein